MLAALGNGVKGGKWFSLMDKVYATRTLELAWSRVEVKRGAGGIDGQSIARFAADEGRYLEELHEALKAEGYQPQPVRRVDIPKAGGAKRPLGIPTVKDRVVQGALKLVLEPIFEREFVDTSYGFRPGRGCKDALRQVQGLLDAGYAWIVDADIQSYFDNIPHARLMSRVQERVSDGRVLRLVEKYLKQDIVSELARWTPTRGTPQGAVLSPLLANIYLHPLDVELSEAGYQSVRYADDMVIACRTREEAEAALAQMQRWCESQGLRLHPDKTHVGDCRVAGQGFDFLGYRFEAGRRWVRKKSLKAFKTRIKEKTRRTRGQSLRVIIDDLNPSLQGWFAYFKHADRYTFRALDGFIRRRLRALLRKQQHRPGMGMCAADHHRWPNVFFARHGLFTLETARAMASQSR
ncbi:MAG: group II intron reverse transcriptase/maturase [Proteobacteria bacterium]|nr:group II intron reverse transcriptase/maturase [Pseudomonadota bacterium]